MPARPGHSEKQVQLKRQVKQIAVENSQNDTLWNVGVSSAVTTTTPRGADQIKFRIEREHCSRVLGRTIRVGYASADRPSGANGKVPVDPAVRTTHLCQRMVECVLLIGT